MKIAFIPFIGTGMNGRSRGVAKMEFPSRNNMQLMVKRQLGYFAEIAEKIPLLPAFVCAGASTSYTIPPRGKNVLLDA